MNSPKKQSRNRNLEWIDARVRITYVISLFNSGRRIILLVTRAPADRNFLSESSEFANGDTLAFFSIWENCLQIRCPLFGGQKRTRLFQICLGYESKCYWFWGRLSSNIVPFARDLLYCGFDQTCLPSPFNRWLINLDTVELNCARE